MAEKAYHITSSATLHLDSCNKALFIMINQSKNLELHAVRSYLNVGEKGPWVMRCVPGIGNILTKELGFRRVIPWNADPVLLRQRNHDFLFLQRTGEISPGPTLRIPEEIHYCLIFGRYKISNSQIERLASILLAQKTSFRIIVTADGSHFSRQDMKRWLSNKLLEHNVHITEDAENVLWLFCIETSYYICLLRCSTLDSPFRHSRVAERPGSLPPTIAAAMAFLGAPKPGEVILDPVCGSGTLLAEAYGYAADDTFLGFDIDQNATEAARKNLSHIPRHKIVCKDGTQTDLPSGSVNLFLANLPFGKQYGSRETNPQLYHKLISEIIRLGVPKQWRAILLSSDIDAVESVLAAYHNLSCTKRTRIKVRGEWAQIFAVYPSKGS